MKKRPTPKTSLVSFLVSEAGRFSQNTLLEVLEFDGRMGPKEITVYP